jgi:crotonobetainyl-CoA:carnitine CoA-transferase CaiB-like acyl-CoA transferase
MKAANPRLVYCSITGCGPTGPMASRAGHYLSYVAESGLLGVVHDTAGAPSLPKFQDDSDQQQAVMAALEAIFVKHPAAHWRALLDGEDVCTVIVNEWDEAVTAGLVDINALERVSTPEFPTTSVATMPTSVDPALRRVPYPALQPLPPTSPWA